MSGPVVFIGYLFLVPSVFGILIGGLMLLMSILGSAAAVAETPDMIKKQMQEIGIPGPLVEKIGSGQQVTEDDLSGLSEEQRQKAELAQAEIAGTQIGAGAAGVLGAGVSIGLMILSFCSGLLGWLLIMKKKVLQCNSCDATVAAG